MTWSVAGRSTVRPWHVLEMGEKIQCTSMECGGKKFCKTIVSIRSVRKDTQECTNMECGGKEYCRTMVCIGSVRKDTQECTYMKDKVKGDYKTMVCIGNVIKAPWVWGVERNMLMCCHGLEDNN